MDRNISYDGTFKETLDGFTGEDIIELINELFQRDYPRNSEVIRLATESHADGEERRSDSVLRIGGESMYHIEIQSSPDKTITLRVFEYAYRVAMQHGKEQGTDYLKLDFPKTVVFYLRSDEKTPRELSIELNLPDGSTAAYKVPTKRLEEYKPEDLVKKSMLIFAPFYSMLWEKKLEQNPAALKELKAAVLFITDGINERLQKGEISKKSADFAVNALRCVFKNVLDKAKLNQQEVKDVMEAVERQYNLDINIRYAEGRAAGKAEGRKEGKAEGKREGRREGKAEGIINVALRMLSRGKSIEEVAEDTGLTFKEIELLQKQ